jgi:hypothetical protein
MRRLIALAVVAAAVLGACAGDDPPENATAASVTATAGEIEVTATPTAAEGVTVIRVVFDTHAVDLDFDPAEIAVLSVGERDIRASSWEGPGAGGHHREGDLTFDLIAAVADLTLTLELDPPITLSWDEEV